MTPSTTRKPPPLHSWNLTPKEALDLQRQLANRVDVTVQLKSFETVAGCDLSYDKASDALWAAVVVVRAGSGQELERVVVKQQAEFPYVPGLLSFREAPALLAAFEQLHTWPDVVMVDGQGIAHPRRFGAACHLGLWLELPTLGCAKSRLIGDFEEPGPEAGAFSQLSIRGEVVGAVFRSRSRVKPLFISPGHRIDLPGALDVIRRTSSGFRLPWPSRLAHIAGNEARTAAASEAAQAGETGRLGEPE